MNPELHTLSTPCLSEYRLDRHFLELETAQERSHSSGHLEGCPSCQRELEQLVEAQNQPILLDFPSFSWRRFFPDLSGHNAIWLPVMAAGAFCLVALGVQHVSLQPNTPSSRDGFLIRGTPKPTWLIARKHKDTIQRVSSGAWFAKGDLLVIGYRWRTRGYVYLLHRDPKGLASPLYPTSKKQSSLPSKSAKVILPGSLEVDGEPAGFEEIWGCFSSQTRTFQQVVRALPPRNKRHPLSQVRSPHPKTCTHLLYFVMRRTP